MGDIVQAHRLVGARLRAKGWRYFGRIHRRNVYARYVSGKLVGVGVDRYTGVVGIVRFENRRGNSGHHTHKGANNAP